MPLRKTHQMHKHQGFTLIELMIVVVVVAVLSAIALPSYSKFIRKGHRSEARAGLLQAQQWLERAATAHGTYPTALPEAFTWTGDAAKRYTIGFKDKDETSFTLIATRKTGTDQADDDCGDYTLTHTGEQGLDNVDPGDKDRLMVECWRK